MGPFLQQRSATAHLILVWRSTLTSSPGLTTWSITNQCPAFICLLEFHSVCFAFKNIQASSKPRGESHDLLQNVHVSPFPTTTVRAPCADLGRDCQITRCQGRSCPRPSRRSVVPEDIHASACITTRLPRSPECTTLPEELHRVSQPKWRRAAVRLAESGH